MSKRDQPYRNGGIPAQSLSSDYDPLSFEADADFDEADTNPDATELTAYLDGELEPTQAFQVENRLNNDPHYLAEMQALQKAWDLLDHLPGPSSSNDFVRTTMELVVADAVKQRQVGAKPLSWLWKGAVFLLVPLCFLAVAYAANRAWQMKPHLTLMENFDLILNLEKYHRVGNNIEFLVRLNDLELFSDEIAASYRTSGSYSGLDFSINQPEEGDQTIAKPDPRLSMEELQSRIAAMDPGSISGLQKNFEKFNSMSAAEIETVKSFHNDLTQRPDSRRLKTVLNAYDDWLKRLGTTENYGAVTVAEVLDLPIDDRLRKVSQIRFDQIRDALGRWGATRLPNDRDVDILLSWFELSINANQAQIRQRFAEVVPEFYRRERLSNGTSPEAIVRYYRRQPIRQVVAILFHIDRQVIEDIVFQDIHLLLHALSPEAKRIMSEYDVEDQKELVMNWIDAGIQAKATIPEEKLQAFYESLPSVQREELDQMSIDEWNAKLTRMYWEQNQDSRLFREWQNQILRNRLFP